MLFNQNPKKVGVAWKVFSAIIIIGMILVYLPLGLFK